MSSISRFPTKRTFKWYPEVPPSLYSYLLLRSGRVYSTIRFLCQFLLWLQQLHQQQQIPLWHRLVQMSDHLPPSQREQRSQWTYIPSVILLIRYDMEVPYCWHFSFFSLYSNILDKLWRNQCLWRKYAFSLPHISNKNYTCVVHCLDCVAQDYAGPNLGRCTDVKAKYLQFLLLSRYVVQLLCSSAYQLPLQRYYKMLSYHSQSWAYLTSPTTIEFF